MKKPVKPIPLGPALDTPDDQLDLLALISIEDIEAAKADARARMSTRGAALLETEKAERAEGGDDVTNDTVA